jgi:hypothetical protein
MRVQADASAAAQASARVAFGIPEATVTVRGGARGSVSALDPRTLSYGQCVPLRARA